MEPYQRGAPGTEFSLPIFTFPEPEDLSAGQHLFRNLTRIELNMSLDRQPSHSGTSTIKQLANMAELIATAADLRSLALHMSQDALQGHHTHDYFFPDGRSTFPYLGLEATWLKLRSMSLQGIFFDEKEVNGLIRRHKDTLWSLVVKECSLRSGFWAEVVDEVVFNSSITLFALNQVDERPLQGTYWSIEAQGDECWKYEGHLIVSDGDRAFVGFLFPIDLGKPADEQRLIATMKRNQFTTCDVGSNMNEIGRIALAARTLRGYYCIHG